MKPQTLRTLLLNLDTVIQSANEADLPDTAALLRLARLDLMLRAHGMTVDDITPISQAKTRLARKTRPARSKKSSPR